MENKNIIILFFLFLGITCINAQRTAFIDYTKLYEQLGDYAKNKATIDSLTNEIRNAEQAKAKIEDKKLVILKKYNATATKNDKIPDEISIEDVVKMLSYTQELKKTDGIINEGTSLLEELTERNHLIDELISKEINEYSKKFKINAIYKLDVQGGAIVYYNAHKDITNEIANIIRKKLDK